MARIFRFNQQAAYQLMLQAAQQAGLPVNMPQITQGVQALLAKLAEYGIGLSVDDSSPYFQNLMANFGQNGAGHNVRTVMPGQPQQQQMPQQPQFQPMPQPQYVPQQQMPTQQPIFAQPMQPQPMPPGIPMVQPQQAQRIPGAIVSGQPLPDLLPPPHMRAPMPGPGITPLPGGPVQMQAQGLGDNPQGMTEPPPPAPTILE